MKLQNNVKNKDNCMNNFIDSYMKLVIKIYRFWKY